MENMEREKRLKHDFENLFIEADLFAIGTKLTKKATTPSTLLDAAYTYVIENTFAKLSLLKPTTGDITKEIQAVLMADDIAQTNMDFAAEECNPQAMQAVEQHITLRVERNEALYLRDLISHFTHRPYGWLDDELLLITARLGLAGKISFTLQGAPLALNKAYEPFTNSRKRGELRIQKIRLHDEKQLKKAVVLVKSLFSKTFTGSGEKELTELIKQALKTWQDELKAFDIKSQTGQFPSKDKIESGLILLASILDQRNSFELIKRLIEESDALEDFAEDFEDLGEFYNSQFQTWQSLAKALTNHQANRPALEKHQEALKALQELERIYGMAEPYGQLRHIKPLIETLEKISHQLVNDKRIHALERVELRIARITTALTECAAPAELKNKALLPLQKAKQRIESTNSIPQIISEQADAETYEEDADQLINAFIDAEQTKLENEQRRKEAEAKKSQNTTESKVAEPAPVTPKPKRTVTINPAEIITSSSNAFIETEEQVEQYLEQLRKKLLLAVQAGDKVRLK